MNALAEELEHRARILDNLHFKEASPRVHGLLKWMESKEDAKAVIDQLDSEADGMALLNAATYHHPPKAGTEEEIAAVGLALMRVAAQYPLSSVLTARGIRASGSTQFQDHVDSAVFRYFRPFVEFVSSKLRVNAADTTGPERIQAAAIAAGFGQLHVDVNSRALVDPTRIEELKQLSTDKWDFSKLIRLCEELNISYVTDCYFAVAMLTRSVLDHVAPVFDCRTFSEVGNNYAGTKSFKASMQTLENSSRNIANQHLHGQIRPKEVLPNARQINFSNDLDVLLGEIVRLHKPASAQAEPS